MKVTKQSLVDWQVTENGKPIAWIQKVKDGYHVTFKCFSGEPYWFPCFKSAKQFAVT